MDATPTEPRPETSRVTRSVVICGFVAIAGFFVVSEHRGHAWSALPYLLLLACPVGIAMIFDFSFFKPHTKRDWRTFGSFSAFIRARHLGEVRP